MGLYLKKIFKLLLIMGIIITGCEKKETKSSKTHREEVQKFSFEQFGDNNIKFTVTGETAEISSEKTSISTPQLSLTTEDEIIEIITGKEGSAEILIDDEKKIKTIIIKGNIKLVSREVKTQNITMEAECKKILYDDGKKIITLEGSPTVKRGNNYFSGDIMYYNLEKNSLEIKGNVNAQIYSEKGNR